MSGHRLEKYFLALVTAHFPIPVTIQIHRGFGLPARKAVVVVQALLDGSFGLSPPSSRSNP